MTMLHGAAGLPEPQVMLRACVRLAACTTGQVASAAAACRTVDSLLVRSTSTQATQEPDPGSGAGPALACYNTKAWLAVQGSAEFQQLVALHQSEDGSPLIPEGLMNDPAAIARHLVTTNFPGFVGEMQSTGAA